MMKPKLMGKAGRMLLILAGAPDPAHLCLHMLPQQAFLSAPSLHSFGTQIILETKSHQEPVGGGEKGQVRADTISAFPCPLQGLASTCKEEGAFALLEISEVSNPGDSSGQHTLEAHADSLHKAIAGYPSSSRFEYLC